MGIPVYFWPYLPVTGSPKTVEILKQFCQEKFGAAFHIVTQKMGAREKVELIMKDLKR
jgi:hypothetical protein